MAQATFHEVPISKVRSDLFQLLDTVQSGGRAVTLTRRGEPVAVLLSHAEYERLIETLEVLCDPDFFTEVESLTAEDGF